MKVWMIKNAEQAAMAHVYHLLKNENKDLDLAIEEESHFTDYAAGSFIEVCFYATSDEPLVGPGITEKTILVKKETETGEHDTHRITVKIKYDKTPLPLSLSAPRRKYIATLQGIHATSLLAEEALYKIRDWFNSSLRLNFVDDALLSQWIVCDEGGELHLRCYQLQAREYRSQFSTEEARKKYASAKFTEIMEKTDNKEKEKSWELYLHGTQKKSELLARFTRDKGPAYKNWEGAYIKASEPSFELCHAWMFKDDKKIPPYHWNTQSQTEASLTPPDETPAKSELKTECVMVNLVPDYSSLDVTTTTTTTTTTETKKTNLDNEPTESIQPAESVQSSQSPSPQPQFLGEICAQPIPSFSSFLFNDNVDSSNETKKRNLIDISLSSPEEQSDSSENKKLRTDRVSFLPPPRNTTNTEQHTPSQTEKNTSFFNFK